jgi:hypothetical protein
MEGQGQVPAGRLMEQMQERCKRFMEQMTQAVNTAPDGRWIEGSEVEAFELIHRFGQEVYQAALQGRIDAGQAAAAKSPAAFSPSGSGAGAEQGSQRYPTPGPAGLGEAGAASL